MLAWVYIKRITGYTIVSEFINTNAIVVSSVVETAIC